MSDSRGGLNDRPRNELGLSPVKWTRLKVAIFSVALYPMLLVGGARAQTVPPKTIDFGEFLKGVSESVPGDYLGRSSDGVKSVTSFEEMRQYTLQTYRGVTVEHSFAIDSTVFDCIPILQQPTARQFGLTTLAAEPPAMPLPMGLRSNDASRPSPAAQVGQTHPGQTADAFGNSLACSAGRIPMRRTTLDELTRFETLQQFFKKEPFRTIYDSGSSGQQPRLIKGVHKYAHSYQPVTNIGGSSDINLWNPSVDQTAGQVFTLSQQWYTNYVGKFAQTAEVGWQVFPKLYTAETPVLFVYWTADGYTKTGCYNLLCAGFVQTNASWKLGGPFQQVSSSGGPQYYFTPGYYLYKGNWWLNINGTWVGYYPGSIYASGPMATSAAKVDFGGETFGAKNWPAMGSGMFASAGFGYAAFQRNAYYVKTPTTGSYAKLKVLERSPSCYTDVGHNTSRVDDWNTYIFFGGPGGSAC